MRIHTGPRFIVSSEGRESHQPQVFRSSHTNSKSSIFDRIPKIFDRILQFADLKSRSLLRTLGVSHMQGLTCGHFIAYYRHQNFLPIVIIAREST
jgi:hypothetical protein